MIGERKKSITTITATTKRKRMKYQNYIRNIFEANQIQTKGKKMIKFPFGTFIRLCAFNEGRFVAIGPLFDDDDVDDDDDDDELLERQVNDFIVVYFFFNSGKKFPIISQLIDA